MWTDRIGKSNEHLEEKNKDVQMQAENERQIGPTSTTDRIF